jgi:hypothetical protein
VILQKGIIAAIFKIKAKFLILLMARRGPQIFHTMFNPSGHEIIHSEASVWIEKTVIRAFFGYV